MSELYEHTVPPPKKNKKNMMTCRVAAQLKNRGLGDLNRPAPTEQIPFLTQYI